MPNKHPRYELKKINTIFKLYNDCNAGNFLMKAIITELKKTYRIFIYLR